MKELCFADAAAGRRVIKRYVTGPVLRECLKAERSIVLRIIVSAAFLLFSSALSFYSVRAGNASERHSEGLFA